MRRKVKSILFAPLPKIGQRIKTEKDKKVILDTKSGYTLYDDKENFPSIFENVFKMSVILDDFAFTIEIKDKNILKDDYRYRWNNADIRGVLKMFCSPDDHKIILPSGIHDFILENKVDVYKKIKSKVTPDEFRRLTSDIFIYLCISQGFSPCKAKIMGNLVDCFQKHFQRRKWQLL